MTVRVKITTDPRDFTDRDAYGDKSYAELVALAESQSPNRAPVRLEVEYRDADPTSETYGEYPDWEISGDAVEVRWDAAGAPTVATLPPYAGEAA